ncbi:MAG: hypothetical protein H6Q56_152 [Deltaproteobacteria bacterium]|nr:hypothetical protein [Deltaproteobacteria bacterium]
MRVCLVIGSILKSKFGGSMTVAIQDTGNESLDLHAADLGEGHFLLSKQLTN